MQEPELKCVSAAPQYTWIAAGVMTVVFCIIWPVMTIPAGVFSLGYFYWFVILSLIWGLVRALSLFSLSLQPLKSARVQRSGYS